MSKAKAEPNLWRVMIAVALRFLVGGTCSAGVETVPLLRATTHDSARPNSLFIQENSNA
jgi:hypothetical protein